MWARLVVAPWWVVWLVNAATFAVTLLAICVLGFPGFAASGWTWPLLSVLGFSAIVTALTTRARRPVQQSYARTVAGLSLPQRSQAVSGRCGVMRFAPTRRFWRPPFASATSRWLTSAGCRRGRKGRHGDMLDSTLITPAALTWTAARSVVVMRQRDIAQALRLVE